MNRTGLCPYCGASVSEDNRFCGNCGQRLDGGAYQREAEREYPWGEREYGEPVYQDVLASLGSRTGGFLVTQLLPLVASFIPFAGLALWIWNLFLFQRGQDIGARLLRMRVVRDTGELAGFFHMWTRNLAATISLIVVGAGYWTAYFDPHRQTWHDKMLGTYVVLDGQQMESRPGTSSSAAVTWFWISLILFIVVPIVITIAAFGAGLE